RLVLGLEEKDKVLNHVQGDERSPEVQLSMEQEKVRFSVAKDDFASALAWVARALPTKPTQPILSGVMILADDDGLEPTSIDREVSTRVHVNANVDETGHNLVAGKLASDIVEELPGKEITMEYYGSTVLVRS